MACSQRGIGSPLLVFLVALSIALVLAASLRAHRGEDGRGFMRQSRVVAPLAGDLSEQASNRPLAMGTLQVVAHLQYDVLLEFVPLGSGGPPRSSLVPAGKGFVLELMPGSYDVAITYLRPGTSERLAASSLPLLVAASGAAPTLDLNQERVSRLPFRVGDGAPSR